MLFKTWLILANLIPQRVRQQHTCLTHNTQVSLHVSMLAVRCQEIAFFFFFFLNGKRIINVSWLGLNKMCVAVFGHDLAG